MELYLLSALIFIYIITLLVGISPRVIQKIWTLAFIFANILTAFSLFALRFKQQDIMLSADTFNWYYFLYIFGMLTLALGIINLWIYRRGLWHLIFPLKAKE